jgi:hypothetical protein
MCTTTEPTPYIQSNACMHSSMHRQITRAHVHITYTHISERNLAYAFIYSCKTWRGLHWRQMFSDKQPRAASSEIELNGMEWNGLQLGDDC